MDWLRGAIVLRRWQLLAASAIVGTLIGASMIASKVAQDDAGDAITAQRNADVQRAADQRAELRRRIVTRQEIRRLARRAASLERPSTADLLRALERASRLCGRAPQACRAAIQRGGGAEALLGRPLTPVPQAQGDATPPRRTTAPTTVPPRRRRRPGTRPQPPSPPSATSPAGPSGPPQAPAPPVVVRCPPSTLPVPLPGVGVTTPLVGVDCPPSG